MYIIHTPHNNIDKCRSKLLLIVNIILFVTVNINLSMFNVSVGDDQYSVKW